jgi:arabinofuranosyltransferase
MVDDRFRPDQTVRLITFTAALVFVIVLARTAWVNDDAYITFRTVDNFIHGYGLRWNVANRVQTFTHPLWLAVMTAAAAMTGDVYYTSIAISILLAIAVLALIGLRAAPSAAGATLAFAVFLLSKSFVEYSTSGLENGLTHLLLLLYLIEESRGHLLRSTLLASLVMLNRLDLALLIVPSLAAVVGASLRRNSRSAAIGFAPFAAWELFSMVYYGFPIPNTGYAKLATGVSRAELVYQGALYLLDALSSDPVTVIVIAFAVVSPVALGARKAIPIGIVLYIVYLVWVGGDFMSGRFLSAPLLCAVVQLLDAAPNDFGMHWAGAMAVVWLTGFLPGWPSNFSGADYGRSIKPDENIRESHVNDDRRYYYPETGLLTAHRGVTMPNHRWLYLGFEARRHGERVHMTDAAGFVGFAAGPDVHVIDRWALGDPLLARLPAENGWQVGHYPRRVPDGYVQTITCGRNTIRDPEVAAFYDKLRIITEAPVWSLGRFSTIVAMNAGRYDHLIANYGRRFVALADVSTVKADGSEWDAAGSVVMTLRGVDVVLPRAAAGGRVELSVSGNDVYRVDFLRGARRIGGAIIAQPYTPDGSLLTHSIAAPSDWFDVIRILPSGGDSQFSLGHLRLVGKEPQE